MNFVGSLTRHLDQLTTIDAIWRHAGAVDGTWLMPISAAAIITCMYIHVYIACVEELLA